MSPKINRCRCISESISTIEQHKRVTDSRTDGQSIIVHTLMTVHVAIEMLIHLLTICRARQVSDALRS